MALRKIAALAIKRGLSAPKMRTSNFDGPISPLHDIPLFVDETNRICNMVVKIPRWTNAEMEIALGEILNPIRPIVHDNKPSFYKNCFPYHGYLWNFGSMPQTWANPLHKFLGLSYTGNNEPLDVIEIGQRVAEVGEVLRVKVVGAIATTIIKRYIEWKIVVVDISDPLAGRVNELANVREQCPMLIERSSDWFSRYDVPEYEPENRVVKFGERLTVDYTMRVIREAHSCWAKLIEMPGPNGVDRYNTTIAGSMYEVDPMNAREMILRTADPVAPLPLDQSVDKIYYCPVKRINPRFRQLREGLEGGPSAAR